MPGAGLPELTSCLQAMATLVQRLRTIVLCRLKPMPAGLPVFSLEAASFPLTFATWEGASAEDFWQASQWSGAAAGMFLTSSPLFSDVQVGPASRLPATDIEGRNNKHCRADSSATYRETKWWTNKRPCLVCE